MYITTVRSGGTWIKCTVQLHSSIEHLINTIRLNDNSINDGYSIYEIVPDSQLPPRKLSRKEIVKLTGLTYKFIFTSDKAIKEYNG